MWNALRGFALVAVFFGLLFSGCSSCSEEQSLATGERLGAIGAGEVSAKREIVAPLEAEPAPPETARLPFRYEELSERFHGYFRNQPRRFIYAAMDRPVYRPGQAVQWRSWHVEAGSFALADDERAEVTIELRNPRGQVVHTETVTRSEGMTSGSFALDEEVRGGRWMLRINDGQERYERPVQVARFEPTRFRTTVEFPRRAYRPGERVAADLEVLRDTGEPFAGQKITGLVQASGRVVEDLSLTLDEQGKGRLSFRMPTGVEQDVTLVLTVEEGDLVESSLWPVPTASSEVKLTFYPEGGKLVDGLTSRVYFEAGDRDGNPIEVEGSIVDNDNRVVAEFSTSHRGRGRFEFTPEEGQRYNARIRSPARVRQEFALPRAEETGCVLRVFDDFDSQKDAVRTSVHCSSLQLIFVAGFMADRVVAMVRTVAGPEEPAVVYLRPGETWPRAAGTLRIAVFDGEYLDRHSLDYVFAERLVFVGRRTQFSTEVRFDRDFYHPGDTVEVELVTRDPDGRPVEVDLSALVVDDRLFLHAPQDVPSILGQLLLKADNLHFWGEVEEANEYFDLYRDSAKGLDLLMGTRGMAYRDRDRFYVSRDSPLLQTVQRTRAQREPQIESIGGRSGGAGGRLPELVERLEAVDTEAAFDGTRRSASAGSGDRLGRSGSDRIISTLAAGTDDAPLAAAAPEEPADTLAQAPRYFRDDDVIAFVAWEPRLKTGARDGRARFSFELPEAIGAYRLVIEGIGAGLLGRQEEVIRLDVPLSVALRLPSALSGGDEVDLPVTVRNNTDEVMQARVQVRTEGPLSVGDEKAHFEISVEPRATATAYVTASVVDSRETATVSAWVEGGGFSDGAERQIEVEPRGLQRTWHHSGAILESTTFELPLQGMTAAGARAELVLYPGPVAEALEGVDQMARRPTGCFEQTSSRNHPNLLVYHYLKSTGVDDPEVLEELVYFIQQGYERIMTFEIPGGGFQYWGRGRAQAPETAWGLVQLAMLQDLVTNFDEGAIDRAVDFLKSLRGPDGTWKPGVEQSWQRMPASRREPLELFILYALARAEKTEGFERHFDRAAAHAMESDHLYEVALAAAALAFADPQRPGLREILRRLESMQNEDGSFTPEKGRGWSNSQGHSFDVETTGIAALALTAGNGSPIAAGNAINWLGESRTRNGWWGTTQATVMALEARVAYEQSDLGVETGAVKLFVGDELLATESITTGENTPVRIAGFGEHLSQENNRLRLESELRVGADLEVNWRVEHFAPLADAPLNYTVHFANEDSVTIGDEVSITVTIENREDHPTGMVLARIVLPGALEVAPRELDALIEGGDADLYETDTREIILYFEDLGAGATKTVRFSAVATVPGTFERPASVAYPYYRDEGQWVFTEPGLMRVKRP